VSWFSRDTLYGTRARRRGAMDGIQNGHNGSGFAVLHDFSARPRPRRAMDPGRDWFEWQICMERAENDGNMSRGTLFR